MYKDIIPTKGGLYIQGKAFKIGDTLHQIRFYENANKFGSKEYGLLSSNSHIELGFTKKELEKFLSNKQIIDA